MKTKYIKKLKKHDFIYLKFNDFFTIHTFLKVIFNYQLFSIIFQLTFRNNYRVTNVKKLMYYHYFL